jgi:hypothetical protein
LKLIFFTRLIVFTPHAAFLFFLVFLFSFFSLIYIVFRSKNCMPPASSLLRVHSVGEWGSHLRDYSVYRRLCAPPSRKPRRKGAAVEGVKLAPGALKRLNRFDASGLGGVEQQQHAATLELANLISASNRRSNGIFRPLSWNEVLGVLTQEYGHDPETLRLFAQTISRMTPRKSGGRGRALAFPAVSGSFVSSFNAGLHEKVLRILRTSNSPLTLSQTAYRAETPIPVVSSALIFLEASRKILRLFKDTTKGAGFYWVHKQNVNSRGSVGLLSQTAKFRLLEMIEENPGKNKTWLAREMTRKRYLRIAETRTGHGVSGWLDEFSAADVIHAKPIKAGQIQTQGYFLSPLGRSGLAAVRNGRIPNTFRLAFLAGELVKKESVVPSEVDWSLKRSSPLERLALGTLLTAEILRLRKSGYGANNIHRAFLQGGIHPFVSEVLTKSGRTVSLGAIQATLAEGARGWRKKPLQDLEAGVLNVIPSVHAAVVREDFSLNKKWPASRFRGVRADF